MSSDPSIVLSAHNVSKRFRLGQFVSLATTLRTCKRALANPFSYFGKKEKTKEHKYFENIGDAQYLWALRNVSLELRKGERVAILGHNGAGKSTLLKILVGIMTPTEGSVYANCRIVPLLGVGAGFTLELTGRENVFIYGSVLGISRKEVRERYDEIVAFAEIPQFMDTPVKRYSKGMRARLGMAVALSLKPDVLVVDEVLAVGDVKFRAKCTEAIKTMCKSGMTLLFVSHSAARVKALCDRAILLRKGQLIEDGDSHIIVERYLREDMSDMPQAEVEDEVVRRENYCGRMEWELEHAPGDEIVQITMVRVTDEQGKETQSMDIRRPIILEMEYVVHEERVLRPQFQLYSPQLEILFTTVDSSDHWRESPRMPGVYRSRACIPGNTLGAKTFVVGASVYDHKPLNKHARTADVVSFTVTDVHDPASAQSDYPRPLPGFYRPLLAWETETIEVANDLQLGIA